MTTTETAMRYPPSTDRTRLQYRADKTPRFTAPVDFTAPFRLAPYLALSVLTIGCAILAARQSGPGPVVMAAIAAASFVSSIAGFAFSAICGAMLFHLWDNHIQVVQIMIACSIANQATMVWALRRDIDMRRLGVLLFGGLAGLPLGIWALLHAEHAVYARAFGIFLFSYAAYLLAVKPRVLRLQHPGLDLTAGFLGGITGGMAGFPGASVAIWCGMKGWDKARQRALSQPFILLMQIAALFAISALKPHTAGDAGFEPANLLCLPAGLLGTCLGMVCFRRLSDSQFNLALKLMLMVSGLSYIK